MDNQIAQYALSRARAMHELQLQMGFTLKHGKKMLGYAFAAEFVGEELWTKFAAFKPVLLLSPARASVLGIKEIATAVENLSFAQFATLIVGAKDAIHGSLMPAEAPIFAADLINLAKQAGIIPAMLWFEDAAPFVGSFVLDEGALIYKSPVELIRGDTVALPLENAQSTTITSFRTRFDTGIHLVLVVGDVTQDAPMVRVHSSCVTGDLLGSLRCDCGGQLQAALTRIKQAGAGILLYLYQEGRGIGITSKLRAYGLQEQGMDTFAANNHLGYEEDERDFSVAAALLNAIGVKQIRLLTNNPDKILAFDASGITVTERLPLIIDSNAHNHAYLETKKTKHGHLS